MLTQRLAKALMLSQLRNRASYYQQPRRFPPAFIRRFYLRHPNANLYIVFAFMSSAMIGPVLVSVYHYMTMSKEQFTLYARDRKELVLERQKFGKELWFPSLPELPDFIRQFFPASGDAAATAPIEKTASTSQ